MWYVYIILCQFDQTLYTGITNHLERRLKQHTSNKGAKYTRGRGPFTLIKCFTCQTRSEALILEARIKKLSRLQKLQYVT